MRILYYLDPGIELGNPTFRYATLRNSILLQLRSLASAGHEVVLVASDAVANMAIQDGNARHIPSLGVVDTLEWSGLERGAARSLRHHLGEFEPGELDSMSAQLKAALPAGFVPDLILVWESPAAWLRSVFPGARLLFQMPGFFSRPPFPNLVAHDVGMLEQGTLQLTAEPLSSSESLALDELRSCDAKFLQLTSPIRGLVSRVRQDFERIVLFPLQIDGYFMIDCVLGKRRSQLEFLTELLKACPPRQAVWVTNYKSRDVQSAVLTQKNVTFLKQKFPNFVYFEELDEVPSVSQILVPELDGVVTISSSIGYQAAYWKKPAYALGQTHITPFASSSSLAEFFEQSAAGLPLERDAVVLSTIAHRHPSIEYLASKDFGPWLEHFVATGELRRWEKGSIVARLRSERRESDALEGARFFERSSRESRMDHCRELSQQLAKHDIISFDVFDTLLMRPFHSPADLFDFMEPAVCDALRRASLGFRNERRRAEQRALSAAVQGGQGETTIEEIYVFLAEQLELTPEQRDTVKALELGYEADLLYPRATGFNAFQEARSLGRRIVLISDMYLSEAFLHRVLAKHGYGGYEKLFVSSAYGAKKQRGLLFDRVLEHLSVSPERILHIGDSLEGDVKQAKGRGLKPFHLPKAGEVFVASDAYARVWRHDQARHTLDWRMVLSVIGNHLHDNPYLPHRKGTLFGGDPWRVGYYGLGPLLLGYVKWLMASARRAGVERLYFLARDGRIMMDAYQILEASQPGAPTAHYVLCSRRAVNVAKIQSEADVMDLLHVDFAHRSVLGHLLVHRFGATRDDVDDSALAAHGFEWSSRVTKDDLPRLVPLFRELAGMLIELAARERRTYLEYLSETGLFDAGKVAVVDIGYAGTMQESLAKLTPRADPIGGYYLMTFRPALRRLQRQGLSCSGYLGEFIDRHDTYHPFCRHVPLYETLMSSSETSFLRMDRDYAGKRTPVFMPESNTEQARTQLVSKVQAGALEFVREMVTIFGAHLNDVDIEPNKSLRVLDAFFREPHPRDARIFAGIAFEDAYGGRDRYLVPPLRDLKADAIWEAGKAALVRDAELRHREDAKRGVPVRGGVPTSRSLEATALRDSRVRDGFTAALIGFTLRRILGQRKRAKFEKRPQQFFRDSRHALVRVLGRMYLRPEPD